MNLLRKRLRIRRAWAKLSGYSHWRSGVKFLSECFAPTHRPAFSSLRRRPKGDKLLSKMLSQRYILVFAMGWLAGPPAFAQTPPAGHTRSIAVPFAADSPRVDGVL